MESGARELRKLLSDLLEALAQPGARVRFPSAQPLVSGREQGHFHLRAELFFQSQASTRFRFPGETLDLGPGEVLIVPAKVRHHETIVEGPAPFCNLVLYADEHGLSCHVADGQGGQPRIAYPENLVGPPCGRVAGWLADAVETHREFADPGLTLALVGSVARLTLQLLDRPDSQPTEPMPVVRCRRMIHEDLGNPGLSVASLAQRLGCSADYLSHLFRTVRGERLTSYIEEQRMLRAAELLVKTALSCKEVAWACGYASQSYFIRCFRRRWKASPIPWRSVRP